MKLLVVAATRQECEPLWGKLGIAPPTDSAGDWASFGYLDLQVLVTGLGMTNAAFQLGKRIAENRPDMALQLGIAGAFPAGPQVGEVVEVIEESFPELGADSPDGFIGLAQMGFPLIEVAGEMFFDKLSQPRPGLSSYRHCRAITVNRVSGTASGIVAMESRCNPEIETMEGAAFFQACLLSGLPFRQIRAISNLVEPRDRSRWRIPQAIDALASSVASLLLSASTDPRIL